MDSTAEHTEKLPREVPIGEWVRPFENYDEITPFIGRGGINNYLAKSTKFNSPPIGKWQIGLDFDQEAMEDAKNNPEKNQDEVVVLMPNGARIIRDYELTGLQKELETRLLKAIVIINRYGSDPNDPTMIHENSGHRAVIRIPSGEEFTSEEIFDTQGDWKFNNVTFNGLYVPDSANIAESIELKLEKVEDNQNE